MPPSLRLHRPTPGSAHGGPARAARPRRCCGQRSVQQQQPQRPRGHRAAGARDLARQTLGTCDLLRMVARRNDDLRRGLDRLEHARAALVNAQQTGHLILDANLPFEMLDTTRRVQSDGKVITPLTSAGPAAGAIYVASNGATTGPFRRDELVNLCGAGMVTATTLVWQQGMTSWTTAGDYLGIPQARPTVLPQAATPPAPR